MDRLAQLVTEGVWETWDFPAPGVLFRDLTPLFTNGSAFAEVIDLIATDVEKQGGVDLVGGIEARGFLLAAALGYRLGVGVLPVRKIGKTPPPAAQQTYALEYGEATIELSERAVAQGSRVALIDDVLATGGTLAAAHKLATRLGATVVQSWVLIELADLGGAKALSEAGIEYRAALTV